MCDYSLLGIRNRLAVEGEQLLVHRFPSGSMGLASPCDLRPAVESLPDHAPARWWASIKSWFGPNPAKSAPAVCIPPGARLMLHDIPRHVQLRLGTSAVEEVTFVQLSAEPYTYRDAILLQNGQSVLLQRLAEGQQVSVLCLASVEATPWHASRAAAPADDGEGIWSPADDQAIRPERCPRATGITSAESHSGGVNSALPPLTVLTRSLLSGGRG
jgi:hypothetical protein